MPNEQPDDDIIHDAEQWLIQEQAQAMLDLFEEDCGRTPATMEEVHEWASSQNDKHLQFRVDRRLDVVLDTYENAPASGAMLRLRRLSRRIP